MGAVAAVAALSSCSSGTDRRASPDTVSTTTLDTSTTSTSPLSSTTTTVAPTTVTSRPTTTAPAASPEGYAQALYAAWAAGDRAAAGRVAQPEAVTTLFARPWQASDGWSFSECSGAAGSVICTWRRPSGQQVLFRVQNRTGGLPVTVSEVRFQP